MSLNKPSSPLVIHDFEKSGHAHRVRLMASLLGLPVDLKHVDLAGGEQQGEAFLKLNPFGLVPVLEDDGNVVRDSTSILVYLAKKYGNESWLPTDAVDAALVQRYLSIASNELYRGPCSARLVTVFEAPLDHEQCKEISKTVLSVLDSDLEGRDFLVTDNPTIADVASYSYIAHAPEGDVTLEPYKNIQAWLRRIEALPGFVAMPATKICLAQ